MSQKTKKEIEISIIKDYDNGYGTIAIAEKNNLHRTTVQRILIRNGKSLRKTSPHNHYNVHYFSKYTQDTCYWAGFMIADGFIRKNRDTVSIHLAIVDKPHLVKFSNIIENTGNIINDEDSCCINLSGEWFKNDLSNLYSICPKKSLTTEFPLQVPQEYWSHLIRGIMDGDGSITFTTCSTVSFIGTSNLLTKIAEIFYIIVGVRLKSRNKIPPLQYNSKSPSISYSGKNAKKILDWLYTDSTENTRLTRKYQKYITLF